MKNDITAIGIMCAFVSVIMLITLLFVAVAQYFSNVAYRAGLVSSFAQWTIYVMGLILCISVLFSIVGRIADGKWWWK